MKYLQTGRTRGSLLLTLSGTMLLLSSGCVTTSQYVNKSIANDVRLEDSKAHSFRTVNVHQADEKLIVYGQAGHHHVRCDPEGHVDLAVVSRQGDVEFSRSIVLSRRQSRKGGWHRAAFRAELDHVLAADSAVKLVFHDGHCITTGSFDCQENNAITAAAVTKNRE